METNADRARARLTLAPDAEFDLEGDGFIGALYRPMQDGYAGKAVVMFGGSDGIFPLTRLAAEEYVKRGMTVLALAYWNEPGLPDSFGSVPVESVERAALWLREHESVEVGLWGISMGAELALLAGGLMPETVSSVTAVCPMNICTQGFAKKGGVKPLDCSAFSWRGEDLPWARLGVSKAAVVRDCLRERGVCLRSCYEDAVLNAPEEARIPVERIGGPVLMLHPERDSMWPSEVAAELIERRLDSRGFPHPVERFSYRYASHMLIPIKSRSTAMFRVERKHPEQCWESDLDAFERTLSFWREAW